MKTAKPSAPVIGRRLRRTLGALLAIGFASTWWKFVPTRESSAAPLDPPPPVTLVESVPSLPQSQPRVVVIAIPVLLPFTLPTAPKPQPPRHRPRIVHTQVAVIPTHQPFAVPPPDYVPPVPEVDPVPVVETPVIEDPPVVEMPVEDPIVEQPPTDKPTKNPEPRIRTRSS